VGGEIVDYRDDLFEGCVELFVATFTVAPWEEPWTAEAAGMRLADLLAMPRRVSFVWLDNETRTPVGFAVGNTIRLAEGFAFHLAEFCVHPARQGQGIGSHLLRYLEQAVAAVGVSTIYLTTGGEPVEFYTKLGYKVMLDWVPMAKGMTGSTV
jgi:GNAT superfamily N-acetyltransferase